MVKVIKPIDSDVILVSSELEDKVKGTKNSDEIVVDEVADKKEEEVVLVKPETIVIPEKSVKILLKKNHRCHIGGEWYVFNEGKQYNVPENVKTILMRADDILQPL